MKRVITLTIISLVAVALAIFYSELFVPVSQGAKHVAYPEKTAMPVNETPPRVQVFEENKTNLSKKSEGLSGRKEDLPVFLSVTLLLASIPFYLVSLYLGWKKRRVGVLEASLISLKIAERVVLGSIIAILGAVVYLMPGKNLLVLLPLLALLVADAMLWLRIRNVEKGVKERLLSR